MARMRTSSGLHVFRSARIAAAALTVGGLGALLGGVVSLGALTSHASKGVVISAIKNAKYGTILMDGRTVYTLRPSGVACHKACLAIWPEVLLPKGVTHATAGDGVSAAKLGTVTRAGGARQVTYAGRALYWFSHDTARSQVKGNVSDIWGKWSVVVLVKPAGTGSPTTTTTKPTTTTTKPTTTTQPVTTTTSSGGGGGIGF